MKNQIASIDKEYIPTIIMDERERGEIRNAISKLPIDLEIKILPFGDYLISDSHIIERKRGDDFISSIYDHRLFKQLKLIKTNYKYPLIILESPKRMFEKEFIKKEVIYGAITYIVYKLKIPIIPSSDCYQTAKILYQYAKIAQIKYQKPRISKNLDNSRIISSISREDQSYFIQGFVDTGIVKANKLLDVLKTPEFIIHAIESTEIEYTKKGNPKKIQGIMERITGIGVKYINRNIRLLTESYNQAKRTKVKTRN